MNGLALTRKQAGIAGAAAIVVGVGLILVPGGGPSSQHVSAADAAARVASSSAGSGGSPSPSGSAGSAGSSGPSASGSSAAAAPSSSAAAPSSAAHPAPPPAATTTVTQAGPNSGGGQPPQASSDPASAPRTSAKPSSAPSPHAPAPTTPKPAPPTSNPPAPPAGCAAGSGSSGNAFAPIAGVEHTSCWGLTTESTADDPSRGGGQDLGNLANGAWAEYPKVNFGTGGSQFFGRVASGAVAGISGLVKVHLDSLSNAPVSVFEIANTGGWQSWRTIQMNMNPTSGVHDVYLTFDSGQPQPFVSLHWFDFGN
ncbi:hypothetical protein ABH920_004324 [Catenulispora sp. EB89]|uniref:carbohydrate-binding protein n=1 Tax=Catenulispora sp. EB89 TaxID=3156257 RepID=UPI00351380F5